MRFNFLLDSFPKMPRAGNTSPATLHMRAKEHGVLRAKQGIQNVGRDDRLNIQIVRQGRG